MSYNLSDADRGVIVHAISEAELSCQYALAEDLRAILTRASAATVAEPAKVYPQGVMGIPPYSPPGSGSHQATPVIAWNAARQPVGPKAGQHCVRCGGTFGGWCECSDNRAACARQQVEQYLASSDPEGHRQSIIDHEAEQQGETGADERTPEDDLNATESVLDAAMCDMPEDMQTDYPTVSAYAFAIWQGYRKLLAEARAAQSGQRAGVDGDAKQIADLVLGHAEGLRVSSPLETRKGFGNDVEHCFEVSDGVTRFGVVIILTKLKDAAPTQQQEDE
ncbi:hypothetical protein ABNQ24_12550 [Ralstonia pseudosolanacearum]|uniref:hypothetical protein n=1 Tax=Ralstonia pseudosolanacearum TaxID=1310165 RepID=UPI00336A7CEE